jgi:hypothetical protein
LKIATWSFEKRPILLPDSICPRWKVTSKSIAEWINGHHTKVVSPRFLWDKSPNSTPPEPQKVVPFRMRTHLKNRELRPLWDHPILSPSTWEENARHSAANLIHCAQTYSTVSTSK